MNDRTVTVKPVDVAKFKKLYRLRTGIELDNETATHKLHMLLRQMQAVYQPITSQQANQLIDETGAENDTIELSSGN